MMRPGLRTPLSPLSPLSPPPSPRWFTAATLALATAALASACGDNADAGPDPADTGIAGQVWSDDNGNGVADPDEAPLANVLVYIDANDNGAQDSDEPTARTDADGAYAFELEPGDYAVRQELPFGFRDSAVASARFRRGESRIIGGDDAAPMQYPFMAAVGFTFSDGTFAQFCGGAVISDRWVATAAHCSEGAEPEEVNVLVGANDPADDSGHVLAVSRVLVHPDYSGDVSEGYDIAMWELAEPIDLRATGVHTVAMVAGDTLPYAAVDALATTMGWGVSDRRSDELQHVHAPIVDADVCHQSYASATNFDTQICAGVIEGGIDSCQGDSGGPLVVRNTDTDEWLLAGITSWGEGCALPGYPGVYARVSALAEWALSNIQEATPVRRVTVVRDEIARAEFANAPTVRPAYGSIEARWQLAALAVPAEVVAGTPATFSFRIIDELPAGARNFACEFDLDGAGPAPADNVPCAAGTSEHQAVYADGVYIPQLRVSANDIALTRTADVLIVGEPAAVETSGELTAADSVDPDFSDTYYIDYYLLVAEAGSPVVITADSGEFGMFAALYDADVRDVTNGGGELGVGEGTPDGDRIIVTPEAGRRYLIGISSLGREDTGTYSLEAINASGLEPVTTW